jgi:hypothetical protein
MAGLSVSIAQNFDQTMRDIRYILKPIIFLWAFIALFATTACKNDIESIDDGSTNKQIGVFVSLVIDVPVTTDSELGTSDIPENSVRKRASPTGGESGDSKENGQTNENTISDISVFFYQSDNLNQAITNNVLISGSAFFESSEILPGNVTKTQKVNISKGIYHVLVVANAGDLTSLISPTTKVKDICDYLQKTAWVENGGAYSMFVMSSAKDISIDLSGITTEASPASIRVDVERAAARVDVIPNNSTGLDINNYWVKDYSGNTIGKVVINRIKLINRLTSGFYLVKRVAANMTVATPSYLGDEDPTTGGVQTNYVIDPWSSLKTKDNLTGLHFNMLNGGAGSDIASSLYADYFGSGFSLSNQDAVKSADLSDGVDNFYILGYSLENTTEKNYQLNGYSTGAMFETTYIPLKITSYNSASRANAEISNSSVITFFSYDNGNIICNSLEAVEFTSLKSTQPANDFFAQTFSTTNTWQDVLDYSNRIKDNDILGFKDYLSNKLTGKSMTANLTEIISWNNFVLATFGYSISGGVITTDQNSKDTRSLLSEYGINNYKSGLCYYPYWIRHSNNGTIDGGIMEFGIVRNNIYKLKVNSFSGLGKSAPYNPDTDNPGTQNDNSFINISINVRPWNLISHSDIVL